MSVPRGGNSGGIFSVSELTRSLKSTLEGTFPFVWIRGQVTNLSRPRSGHMYFSLRDEDATLAAVWFKGNQKPAESFDPLTGEVFEDGPRISPAAHLEDGQELICAGKLAVYEARGIYQLVVELAQDAGIGRLQLEFERLRGRLTLAGYFAQERKRPLPPVVQRVAVFTAPSGAAIHDFLRIAGTRGIGASIRVFPVPVQGDEAAQRIVSAMRKVIDEGWAQVIVLIRGGGSLHDLWAFNDEALASAVFESPVPVLAGIGHEIDFTLADLTADVRAATPTHAAQLLWPEQREFTRRLHDLATALDAVELRCLERYSSRLRALAQSVLWHSPQRALTSRKEQLEAVKRLLDNAYGLVLRKKDSELAAQAAVLDTFPSLVTRRREDCLKLIARFDYAGKTLVQRLERRLERADLTLLSLDPHGPLQRGYALVRKDDGQYVKSTTDTRRGELLRVVMRDGELPVRVEGEGA